ncbi:MAG TPA: deoxyguanosinetriphosphate triphosphohydrolase [Fulvivirga sp.]|nr:deoxyguanosinetriphosphate triphosphohydrolase [Fulvivirga sp.]
MNWEDLLSNQRSLEKTLKHEKSRSAFEQDYDRIIFSHPFRRLQDKTQVHPLPEHDFVHTRLTHSLEVSSVGRSLGKKVGEIILDRHKELQESFSFHDFGAIVAAASLAHDIGNPPFGHSGEDAISWFFNHGAGQQYKTLVNELEWADLTSFEGNAQGFRLFNKERYQGMKLTFGTLAAFSKYPRQSIIQQKDPARRSQKKYGFFQSEKDIFEAIAGQTGLIKFEDYSWSRHPLAFLVEAADDICYHLIDMEDGCRMGLVSYEQTVGLFANILKEKFDLAKLNKIDSINERIGTLRALSVGKLIDECCQLFLDKEKELLTGEFDISLVDEIPSASVMGDVIGISIENIYRSKHVMETEAAGFEVLPGLMEVFTEAIIADIRKANTKKHDTILRLFPPEVLLDINQNKDNIYAALMCCVDFISGMTDRHAISLFRKIKGISLPNT